MKSKPNNKLSIDILSDLHIDFYFSLFNKTIKEEKLKSIFDPIFLPNGKKEASDVLVIAGDIGHYNSQNIQMLKIFKKLYYKYIVCVLGNHDYYLLNKEDRIIYDKDSFNRANEMKELINSEENIFCLDGDVVEIEGIKFGGAMGWYSNAYLKAYYPRSADNTYSINNMWRNCSNDARFIKGIENYNDLYKIEYQKLQNIHDKCDIMISHINPSFQHQHINSAYTNQQSNSFFTFNGHRLFSKNIKYWIFGHTHDAIEYDLYDIKCICNPMGYPNENNCIKIKTIEI